MTADTNTEAAAATTDGQAAPTADGGQAAPATGAVATGKQRPQLPEGIVSPISALNTLKQRGLAAQDFKPQQMYGFVKNPGKTDAFPVKHYDAQGNEFDQPQINEHGITTTRPGVKVDEIVAWWGRKGERDIAKAAARKAKADEKAAKEAAAAAGGATQPAGAHAAPAGATATLEDTSAGGEEVGAEEGQFEEAE
jgi:hypothetical protein